MSEFRLTVGLEIHVELETKTKMFCACKNDPFHSEPNTNVCPVCYGLPGALPTLNMEAIKMVVKLGRALGGDVAATTFWARKNYFYPDLPKGYQISQSTAPIVKRAKLTVNGQDYHITRIHLEEDAGKLIHGNGGSFVNYNRAGVPLLELVTEPDFHSAQDAKAFCVEFQRVLRTLKISSADMEKGLMRCEANISVSKSDQLGTKVEVKNINSFRAVERAINYELQRQSKALESGAELKQETRSWNEALGETTPMRSKETSADYRYFPEPDLPIVEIGELEESTEVLPDQMRTKLTELGIGKELISPIIDRGWFDLVVSSQNPKQIAATLLAVPSLGSLDVETLGEILKMKTEYGWTIDTLKEVALRVSESDAQLEAIRHEYAPVTDLGGIIEVVIKEFPEAVNDYSDGKESAFNFLLGKVMSAAKGKANISEVRAELAKRLN